MDNTIADFFSRPKRDYMRDCICNSLLQLCFTERNKGKHTLPQSQNYKRICGVNVDLLVICYSFLRSLLPDKFSNNVQLTTDS